jgi:hypothetical protein
VFEAAGFDDVDYVGTPGALRKDFTAEIIFLLLEKVDQPWTPSYRAAIVRRVGCERATLLPAGMEGAKSL